MKPANYKNAILGSFLAAATLFSAPAFSAELDLRPEQPNRLRTEKSDAVVNAVPKDFKFVQDDKFVVGINPWVPPISTYATDAKTVVAFDPDLIQLVSDTLGRELVLVPIAWADWPLSLESGKFDAVISNVTVTEERKEKFDFSTYRKDELGFYVKADSPITQLKEPKDIAGLKIITDPGTNQENILVQWDKQNVEAGLKPVEIQYYDDDGVKALAIESGRADAVFSVNAVQAYAASQHGKTKLVGTVSGGWPQTAEVAITTRKGSGLADALTLSLNELIKNGKYGQVLERWSLSSEAVDEAKTNPAGLPKSGS